MISRSMGRGGDMILVPCWCQRSGVYRTRVPSPPADVDPWQPVAGAVLAGQRRPASFPSAPRKSLVLTIPTPPPGEPSFVVTSLLLVDRGRGGLRLSIVSNVDFTKAALIPSFRHLVHA